MGKLHRVSLLGALLLGACSSRSVEPLSEGEARPQHRRAKAAVLAPAPDDRLDEHGNLKRGDQRVSWLELPAGFVLQPGATPQLSVYDAQNLPLAKAREFLMARLSPDTIEYRSNGMVFRRCLPTHTELDLPPVEVTLLEVDREKHQLRIMVEDLTPPPTKPLSDEAAARELARARTRIE